MALVCDLLEAPVSYFVLVPFFRAQLELCTRRYMLTSQFCRIFIIEGLFTIACGVAAYFFVLDFPEKAKFLSASDKEIILHRIDEDRADAYADKITWSGVMHNLADWKIWSFGWNSLVNLVLSGVYTYFGQTILKSMGFSLDVVLIMIFPASIAAVIFGFVESIYSDRWHLRAPFIILNMCVWIIGAALIGFTTPTPSRMIGIFFIVMGYVNIIIFSSYSKV